MGRLCVEYMAQTMNAHVTIILSEGLHKPITDLIDQDSFYNKLNTFSNLN